MGAIHDKGPEAVVSIVITERLKALVTVFQLHNLSLVRMELVLLEQHLLREMEIVRELSLSCGSLSRLSGGQLAPSVAEVARDLLSAVRTHAALLRKSSVTVRALVNTVQAVRHHDHAPCSLRAVL